jgi:hypothetical protein
MTWSEPVSARILWEPQQFLLAVECKNAADLVTVAISPKGDDMAVIVFTLDSRGEKKSSIVTAPGRDPEDEKTKESIAALKLDTILSGWNPAWTGAVSAEASGWTAEIAIPFDALPKQLAPPPQNNTRWKINIVATRHTALGASESWALAPTGTPSALGATQRWTEIQFNGQGKK